MKRLFFAMMVAGAMVAGAADPNKYADYGAAMAPDKTSPMAVEWHAANRDAIEKETSDDRLAELVADAESAKALLAKVKPAYATDPMVAAQVAAVSQYVMRSEPSWWQFWAWFSDSDREVWTAALIDAAANAKDSYCKMMFLDQLRWCGFAEQAQCVRKVGKDSKDRAVCQFASVVAAELDPEAKCAKACRKVNCPFGSWALSLPFDAMNAGHLIIEKGQDGKPSALLLWRWASPFKIAGEDLKVCKDGFTLTFHRNKPKGKEQDKSAWRCEKVTAKICGDWAACTLQKVDGNGKVIGDTQTFSAKRNPPIGAKPDLSKAVRGTPVNILGGTIDDFELMEKSLTSGWTLKDGVLSNRIARDAEGKSLRKNGNLRTKRADFFDFNLKYDVRVLPGCNSGVYLRGIYEIQVLDSYGKPVDCHNMAAYYGRVTPRVAAEKKAGEWQTVDVTLYKRHLTVILNGVNIIDNVPVVGITGGAMTANEFVPGPIYIQGDHSDADFRNMVLTPLK